MRRILQWGFKKNVRREERRAILESLGDDANKVEFEERMIRGRRLDKAKIVRWRKREEMGYGGSPGGLAPVPGRYALEAHDEAQLC
jgi:hypothetical protein